jgi:hypothetical protein
MARKMAASTTRMEPARVARSTQSRSAPRSPSRCAASVTNTLACAFRPAHPPTRLASHQLSAWQSRPTRATRPWAAPALKRPILARSRGALRCARLLPAGILADSRPNLLSSFRLFLFQRAWAPVTFRAIYSNFSWLVVPVMHAAKCLALYIKVAHEAAA